MTSLAKPPPAAVVVRPATPEDIPAVGRMGAALMALHHSWDPLRFMLTPDAERGYTWWLGKETTNADAHVLVAVQAGSVVGYAYATHEERDWNALREACVVLQDILVEERARHAGVAHALLDAVKAWARSRGSPRVVLTTATGNTTAQRLFASQGFRPTMVEMTCEL